MKTVHEVSRLTGLSVRALHHYDAIGLLKPAKLTEAGYRLYDEASLRRLQTILMFRELGFPLRDIGRILDSPDFDPREALSEHIALLKLQRKHIDGLIDQAEKLMKGENAGFAAFDRSEMERYAEEVRERWGHTDAYRESLEKTKGKSEGERKDAAAALMAQFAAFGKLRTLAPDSDEAQAAVKRLQDCISANYYRCTKEILAGLGEMYTADERFRESIDGAGGSGTAAFVRDAIAAYCR